MREVISKTGNTIQILESEDDLAILADWLDRHDVFGLDFETTSQRPHEAHLVGTGVGSWEDRTGVYVPSGHVIQEHKEIQKPSTRNGLTHSPKTGKRYTRKATIRVPWDESKPQPLQVSAVETLKVLRDAISNPAKRVVAHNWKYERALLERWCREKGILIEFLCDQDCTLLQDWLVRTERYFPHDLKAAAQREFGVRMAGILETAAGPDGKEPKRKDLQMAFADATQTAGYCGDDAIYCVGLDEVHKPRLRADGLLADYERIELPLIPILIDMERRGVVIDTAQIMKLDDRLRAEMEDKHEEMAAILGLSKEDLPIRSPKKLSELLFEELGWKPAPGAQRSEKTGLYSTDKEMMSFFAEHEDHGSPEQHRFAKVKIRHSQIKKLLENYTVKIVDIVGSDGRIRSQTKQAGTVSGRFSMADPSLHNIPVRSEDGKLIRDAFVADEGCMLIVRDYSQIEPRLTGWFADCPVLREIYNPSDGSDPKDIYMFLAEMLQTRTGVKVVRQWAKALVLGLNYGMGYRKLARDLGISEHLAKRIYTDFFEILREVVRWKQAVVRSARKTEFIKTITGRRRYIPEINFPLPVRSQFSSAAAFEEAEKKARTQRAMSEREAVNTTVQGSAGDILKIAMRNMTGWLQDEGLWDRAYILLTVHDEIILEAENEIVDVVDTNLRRIMQTAVSIDPFPLVASGGPVHAWGAAK